MKYYIAWRVLETGCVEKGTLIYGNLDEASAVARMLNDNWPEFAHWVEPVESASQAQAANASQEHAA